MKMPDARSVCPAPTRSCHLTPTERLNRNHSSMGIYYEKTLGMPPLDLPETLWKQPDANLVFQALQVLSQKDRNMLSAPITLCRATVSPEGAQAVCQSSLFVENTFHNEIQLQTNILKNGKVQDWKKMTFSFCMQETLCMISPKTLP